MVSLALGIGANTAIFSLVDAVLLKLLPVQSPQELYVVMQHRGAQRGTVMWLVLRDAMLMVVAGAAIGVPVALSVTQFARTFLYGVEAHDPLSTALSTLVLLGAAGLASYLPARRATRVDPMVDLRYE